MRTMIIILAAFFSLVSCTNDENNYITIKGRVEREINGEGVSNQEVYLKIKQSHGSGYWSYNTEIDSKKVTTDSNGNFIVSMKNDSNIFVSASKPQDDNYTSFELSSFNPNNNIVLKVNKFIKFKVYINNTNPFDFNDYIHIDFFSGSYQNFRTNIENYGSQNTVHPSEVLPGGGILGSYEEASWNGTNVNSIVYYNVPENADQHKIFWTKRKNTIQTTGFSANIPYQLNQINEYHFDY